MEIKFSGVTKIFQPDIIALEDIYMQVEKGEFVYLVGETGSGKTTLMRCITREVIPTRGQISVGGNLLRKINRFDLALFRRDIGVVFQSFLLLPNLTAFENVAFVLEVMGLTPREITERVSEVLKLVGIWRRRNLYPPQLSGGEQQRIAVARAIAGDPKIILADEPTGSLDAESSDIIMKLLKNFHTRGATVIVATHDKELIKSTTGRAIHLNQGCLQESTALLKQI